MSEIKSVLYETPIWLSKEDKQRLSTAKQKMMNEYGLVGWNALHFAIFYHQNEIAEYLIKMY